MDIGSIIGILIGLLGVLAGYLLEEGDPTKLYQLSAVCIVFGGTIGAVIVSFPFSDLKRIPAAIRVVLSKHKLNEIEIINQLAALSEKARREGILILQEDTDTIENDFIKKGLNLIVDGTEAQLVRDILEREIDLRESQYEVSAKIFEGAGGYAPTMGVLGTVMGMVSILANMDDPNSLGPKISAAFIATMYGVGSANIIFIPIATRIKIKCAAEKSVNELITEGLLSIQAGENPKIMKEKLSLSLLEKQSGKGKTSTTSDRKLEG